MENNTSLILYLTHVFYRFQVNKMEYIDQRCEKSKSEPHLINENVRMLPTNP